MYIATYKTEKQTKTRNFHVGSLASVIDAVLADIEESADEYVALRARLDFQKSTVRTFVYAIHHKGKVLGSFTVIRI